MRLVSWSSACGALSRFDQSSTRLGPVIEKRGDINQMASASTRTVATPTARKSERESPLSFSIVTPCLNAVKTLEATLESVAVQDYPLVEHIVVDGGSTDGTLALLRSRPDVRWISEPDEGLSDAVNKGIAMATGDLIGWLNADDLYHSNA